MQQIAMDYAALNDAIFKEDFAKAATAAHAIAFHGTPSLGTKMKLMGGLRTDMKEFKKADHKVHVLATEVEKSSQS
ncbi:MAG: hypothetical protein Q9N62_14750 [Ghiorsea sp.]|nr:hypothetical protein [Ghiorsea sp.]